MSKADKVIEQGRRAFREGVAKDANPFVYLPMKHGGMLAGWWDKGWEQERQNRWNSVYERLADS